MTIQRDGYLLSHDFNEEQPLTNATSDNANLVPFHCQWQLLLGPEAAEDEIVTIRFEELAIPETPLTTTDFFDDEEAIEAMCADNFIKIYSLADNELLGGYCGYGVAPKLEGPPQASLIIEAKITNPNFQGFNLYFEQSHSGGLGRMVGPSSICPDDSYFACGAPGKAWRCVPPAYKVSSIFFSF